MNAQIDEIKLQIVKAVRMLVNADLLDMNGHLSYRIPGTDRVLINSRKASRASLNVGDIVLIDLDGNLVEGNTEPPSEYHIHTSTYRVRSDVNSVLHHHPHWQTVLGIARQPMQPVFSIGSFVVPEMPVYETSSLVNTREIGDEMAATLADFDVMTIRHHGSVVVGDSVQNVFARAVFVEENCKKQYYASLLGPVQPLTGDNLERTRDTNWKPTIPKKVWDYHEEKTRMDGKLGGIRPELLG
jgi:Ribulose-5-phosphate 4-epimerase and related epimerases and aldolases